MSVKCFSGIIYTRQENILHIEEFKEVIAVTNAIQLSIDHHKNRSKKFAPIGGKTISENHSELLHRRGI